MKIRVLNKRAKEITNQNYKVLFTGRFYYKDRLYQGELPDFFETVKDADELCTYLKDMNGNFSLILQNEKQTLLVADRIMSYPVFYSCKNNAALVSDSIQEMLKHFKSVEASPKVAREFLAAGFVLSDCTVYKGIKFVQAGTLVVINHSTGDVKPVRYFNHEHDNYRTGDMESLSLELEKITDRVFKRMVDELNGRQVVLLLSGGYDSRLVATMLHKFHYKNVVCFSFKTKKGKEEQVAKQIADDLGYPWTLIDAVQIYDKITPTKEYEAYLLEAAGGITMPYIQGCLMKPFYDNGTLDKDCVFLTGNSGDVIEGEDFSAAFKHDCIYSKQDIIRVIIDKFCSLNGLKFGEHPHIKALIEKEIPDRAQYSYEQAQDIYETYNWKHRQVNYVVNDIRCYDIYMDADWRLPLWDSELVDFWLTIPAEIRENRKLYYYYIRHETYDSANTESTTMSLYRKVREFLRNQARFLLRIFYPLRKICEFIGNQKWVYYGVGLGEFIKILIKNGGYATNERTTREIAFFNKYYRPLLVKKETDNKK